MTSKLIEDYVAGLRRSLPAPVANEAADGLIEAYEHHLAAEAGEEEAARAAVAEFGESPVVIGEFTRQAPGRHASRMLLATGPAVGACWAAALILGHAWTWPVPNIARIATGTILLLAITALTLAATSRRSYRRTRLTALAFPVLLTLDSAAIAAALLAAPAVSQALAFAVAASVARICFVLRTLPRLAVH